VQSSINELIHLFIRELTGVFTRRGWEGKEGGMVLRGGWAGATDDTKRIDMVRNLKYVVYLCLII
jgi:hypothetical protein